jgi:UDP-N-acetylmuramyl pentapeptide phosphotransferase/UDP-N-acetylglucosamine-1-phosphate transferase
MISLLAWTLVAGGAGWLVGFPVCRLLARLELLDKPNDRSSHSVPTVRGGGLGIVVIVLVLGGATGLHPPSVLPVAWLLLMFGLAGVSFTHPALVLAAIIAGAAAGFLPHNFPQARMFMGDVGAVFLGFGLAAIAIWIAADNGWWLLVPLGCLHANFVLDTAITVVRRIRRGEVFHQAHREHFYQRLVRAGWSHTRVTLTEAALQVVVAAVLTLGVIQGPRAMLWMVPVVSGIWLEFFAFCERQFRASTQKAEMC